MKLYKKIIANSKFRFLAAVSGWIVAVIGMTAGFDIDKEQVSAFLGETASNQIAQAGLFFTIAAWLHAGRVKKEIKDNFSSLTTAINGVAAAFKEDLKKHSEILENLSTRVDMLEKKHKGESNA
jgi:hypothetical protein